LLLLGSVGRLVEQKGIDVVLKIMPILVKQPLQFIFLGSGNPVFEKLLQKWAKAYPRKIAVTIGYDEQLSHRIEAGSDIFLMPSRFEPCGLNQMYSLHYGTIPIVNKVGGLADTIVHADSGALESGTANGIVVDKLVGIGLLSAIQHATDLFSDKNTWKQLQQTAMQQDFSWQKSAQKYMALYHEAMQVNH
jgi:starch synthase